VLEVVSCCTRVTVLFVESCSELTGYGVEYKRMKVIDTYFDEILAIGMELDELVMEEADIELRRSEGT